MVNENAARDAAAESGELGAQAKIIVLEIAAAERFIQPADGVEHRAFEQQAKADEPVHGLRLVVILLALNFGEIKHGRVVRVTCRDLLRAGNAVGNRAGETNRAQHGCQVPPGPPHEDKP